MVTSQKQTTLQKIRNRSLRSFSIVELVVVIVVIAILATVAVVTYTGIQRRATNTAVLAEFQSWKEVFGTYYALFGRYPNMPPNTHYCLGTGFPDGKCRDYLANNANTYTEADSTELMEELEKTLIKFPSSPKHPVNGTVGPYVTFQENNNYVGMTIVLYGGHDDCPHETDYVWDDGNGRLLCEYTFPLQEG